MNNQICIIAEKPSVAREIARIVGATERAEGYLKGNGYYVTWAFGHLVMPALPEGYGIKGFHRDNLPIYSARVYPCPPAGQGRERLQARQRRGGTN